MQRAPMTVDITDCLPRWEDHPVASRYLRQLVRRADELRYDVFAAPDHLGGLAPITALTAAGMVVDYSNLLPERRSAYEERFAAA